MRITPIVLVGKQGNLRAPAPVATCWAADRTRWRSRFRDTRQNTKTMNNIIKYKPRYGGVFLIQLIMHVLILALHNVILNKKRNER
jgi:hypothetical protein